MAINKVTYGGKTLVDLTTDTVTPDKLASGVTAHDKSGNAIAGTMRCKIYDITITKALGWILLTTLDDDVKAHIDDANFSAVLLIKDEYETVNYSGCTFLVTNTKFGMQSTHPIYGYSHRQQNETAISYGVIYHPANYTGTNIVGGYGAFRVNGGKYYIKASDGYMRGGNYRLIFTW